YVLLLDLFFLCTPTVTSEIHSLSLHDALPISQALLILADLYQVLGMTEVSEAKLKEAARILPDESLIEFALAELYFSINKFDEAQFIYHRLLAKGETAINNVSLQERLGTSL